MINIINKELKSYFHSSTAYIFLFIFLLISGIFFALSNLLPGSNDIKNVLFNMVFIFLFLSPILTMKLFSSETNDKTDQLLLTSPLSLWKIVLGKFFAAVLLLLIGVSILLIYPLILSRYGSIPIAETLGAFIGFLFISMCFISIGMFISSLTSNVVTSAIGTFGALIVIWIMDWITSGLPTTASSGTIFAGLLLLVICSFIYSNTKNWIISFGIGFTGALCIAIIYLKKKALFEGLIVKFFGWFSLFKRYEPFNLGILNLSSIAYYISFIIFFVFLTILVMDRRRWY